MNVIQQISIGGGKVNLYLRGIDPDNQTITYNENSIEPAKTEKFAVDNGSMVFDKYSIPLEIIYSWMMKNDSIGDDGKMIEIPAIYG